MADYVIGEIYVIESGNIRKPVRLLKVNVDRVAIVRCLDEESGELRNMKTPLAAVTEASDEDRQNFNLMAREKSFLQKVALDESRQKANRRPRVWHAR
jgi:hypothetical protein